MACSRRDFNSYGARRGNHEVMVRGTFANIRLKNLLVPGVEGGCHDPSAGRRRTTIFEAAERYRKEGVPLIVIAGKEYGSGSSRDWAAKGTLLLGVRAVIAESYERIHRSNLVGMGVLPLEFVKGQNRADARPDAAASCTRSTVWRPASSRGQRSRSAPRKTARSASSTCSRGSIRPTTSSICGTAGSCRTCCANYCAASRWDGASSAA